jgi:hypothetical protein
VPVGSWSRFTLPDRPVLFATEPTREQYLYKLWRLFRDLVAAGHSLEPRLIRTKEDFPRRPSKKRATQLSDLRFGELFDTRIQTLATTLRPGTIAGYRITARRFLSYLQTDFPHLQQLAELRRDPHLFGWFRRLCHQKPSLSNTTRQNYLLHLRRLLDDLALAADARSDIFSFGLVLHEMLTGKRAFEGASAASVIAAILERESPSVAGVAPPALDRILSRCLAKDPEQRWQSARDLRAALDLAMAQQAALPVSGTKPLPWIVAAVLAVVATVALSALGRAPAAEERALQFHVNVPQGAEFVLASGGSAISPDGRTIAFVATSGRLPKLWVQALDSLTAREQPGTEGAQFPFWSPDSRSIGFFANGKLKRIDPSGGPATILADAVGARGGTWSEDGTIIFTPQTNGGLRKISAAGGTPAACTQLDAASHEVTHRWPQFLPGGRRFIYLTQDTDGRFRIYLGFPRSPSGKKGSRRNCRCCALCSAAPAPPRLPALGEAGIGGRPGVRS